MKKYISGIVAVVIAVGLSAFTHISNQASKSTTYFYEYVGDDQSPQERSDKTNYQNPIQGTDPFNCTGSSNECAVEVNITSGTPPTDLSTLDITFDEDTGMPKGGSDFVANHEQL